MPYIEKAKRKEINTKDYYIVKIEGCWYMGKFVKEWYGWNFDSWGTTGIELAHIKSSIYKFIDKEEQ